ncbi:MAG: hypothetical protein IKS17_02725 [Firmicutes bacterium]|nr:hypothetical protein [Bacillota bacterium]
MNFIEIIKRAALDAVKQSYPLELIFAKVIQEEDIPNNKELLIQVEQKKPLKRAFFIENGKLDGLEEGDRLVILQVQGGQRFYILEVLENDSN